MNRKVLVGYATKYGSTQEVASAIADVLSEGDRSVDLLALRDAKSLEEYSAVVVGAPFYMFKWLKDARKFLSRNQKTLESVPVAVFALGPTDEKETEDNRPEVFAQLDKALEEFLWLNPVDKKIFGGKFDPANLKFPMSLFMGKMPASDIRDWDAIKAWAEGLKSKL